MNVKEAIAIAKRHVEELFGEEGIANVGLEEVVFDDAHDEWRITIGFLRHWDASRGALKDLPVPKSFNRTYKIVQVDQRGRVRGVIAREISA